MSFLSCETSEAVAVFGWMVGAVNGLIVDLAILIAIARAPRLREARTAPIRASKWATWLRRMVGLLVVGVWLAGFCWVRQEFRDSYLYCSATTTGVLVAFLMFVLVPLAATQIQRRSLW